ncbi:uncharacterized protein LOC131931711 [Physella acuta]|uniref:uncharacterized protein LOC131931711 n=1 Tax=Physella acuta TaxID=109671 RepID=UPI0027DD82A4|nr:uncharacterized protein LOC131931711 [Physella acuta]
MKPEGFKKINLNVQCLTYQIGQKEPAPRNWQTDIPTSAGSREVFVKFYIPIFQRQVQEPQMACFFVKEFVKEEKPIENGYARDDHIQSNLPSATIETQSVDTEHPSSSVKENKPQVVLSCGDPNKHVNIPPSVDTERPSSSVKENKPQVVLSCEDTNKHVNIPPSVDTERPSSSVKENKPQVVLSCGDPNKHVNIPPSVDTERPSSSVKENKPQVVLSCGDPNKHVNIPPSVDTERPSSSVKENKPQVVLSCGDPNKHVNIPPSVDTERPSSSVKENKPQVVLSCGDPNKHVNIPPSVDTERPSSSVKENKPQVVLSCGDPNKHVNIPPSVDTERPSSSVKENKPQVVLSCEDTNKHVNIPPSVDTERPSSSVKKNKPQVVLSCGDTNKHVNIPPSVDTERPSSSVKENKPQVVLSCGDPNKHVNIPPSVDTECPSSSVKENKPQVVLSCGDPNKLSIASPSAGTRNWCPAAKHRQAIPANSNILYYYDLLLANQFECNISCQYDANSKKAIKNVLTLISSSPSGTTIEVRFLKQDNTFSVVNYEIKKLKKVHFEDIEINMCRLLEDESRSDSPGLSLHKELKAPLEHKTSHITVMFLVNFDKDLAIGGLHLDPQIYYVYSSESLNEALQLTLKKTSNPEQLQANQQDLTALIQPCLASREVDFEIHTRALLNQPSCRSIEWHQSSKSELYYDLLLADHYLLNLHCEYQLHSKDEILCILTLIHSSAEGASVEIQFLKKNGEISYVKYNLPQMKPEGFKKINLNVQCLTYQIGQKEPAPRNWQTDIPTSAGSREVFVKFYIPIFQRQVQEPQMACFFVKDWVEEEKPIENDCACDDQIQSNLPSATIETQSVDTEHPSSSVKENKPQVVLSCGDPNKHVNIPPRVDTERPSSSVKENKPQVVLSCGDPNKHVNIPPSVDTEHPSSSVKENKPQVVLSCGDPNKHVNIPPSVDTERPSSSVKENKPQVVLSCEDPNKHVNIPPSVDTEHPSSSVKGNIPPVDLSCGDPNKYPTIPPIVETEHPSSFVKENIPQIVLLCEEPKQPDVCSALPEILMKLLGEKAAEILSTFSQPPGCVERNAVTLKEISVNIFAISNLSVHMENVTNALVGEGAIYSNGQ